MILEINTKFLLDYKINAHQYLLVKLAMDGNYDLMKQYLHSNDGYVLLKNDIIALFNAGLIEFTSDDKATFKNIKASDKFIKLFSYTGDPFDEFYSIFPVKVLRPDGSYDYLRMDRNRCKKIYHNLVSENTTFHDHIMRCLKLEIEERSATGKLTFMKRMPTWLSSESWKAYEDKLTTSINSVDTSNDKGGGYGTEVE